MKARGIGAGIHSRTTNEHLLPRGSLEKKSKTQRRKRVVVVGGGQVLITFSGRTNSRECSGLSQSGQLIPLGFITTVGVEAKAEKCRLHQISLREKQRRSMASVG